MEDEIRSQIKRIKIFTKRLVANALSGDYLSAFKGSGMEFDQIRDYQIGDDVRSIDWNSSVRSDKLMVKQFIEERDRTIILMIDVSKSSEYASNDELKKEFITKIAYAFALISNENNDRVGAVFFSDRIEKWIPPNRGVAHINIILESILTLKPFGHGTDIRGALKFLIGLKKHNAVVFMFSDFIDVEDNYSKLLKIASFKHDFIGIRVMDSCEKNMPDIGCIEICDPETGEQTMLDTRGLKEFLNQNFESLIKLFRKYRIDLLDLDTNKPFVLELIRFFHKRIRRSIQ